MTNDLAFKQGKKSFFFRHILALILFFLLLLILFVGGVFFPLSSPIGANPEGGSSYRVLNTIKVIYKVRPGMSASPIIKEVDLNAYLNRTLARQLRYGNMSATLADSIMVIKYTKPFFVFNLGKDKKKKLMVSITYKIKLVADNEHLLSVTAGRVGLIPLPGPFKTLASKTLNRDLANLKIYQIKNKIRSFEIKEHALQINIQP